MTNIVSCTNILVKSYIGLARVSPNNSSKDRFSLSGQQREILEESQARGLQLLQTISATESCFDSGPRVPDCVWLALDRCRQHKAGLIVCFEDRLARDAALLDEVKNYCLENGIALYVIYPGDLTPTIHGGEWTESARQVRGSQTSIAVRERQRQGLKHGRPANPKLAEVLRHRANGHSYWEIAVLTGMKPDTVKKLIQRSNQKLGTKG